MLFYMYVTSTPRSPSEWINRSVLRGAHYLEM
jgi:hypothetical protein